MDRSSAALFDECVDGLYRTLVNPESIGDAMAKVAGVLDAGAISLIGLDRSGAVTKFNAHGYDPAIQQDFIDHYHAIDPGRDPLVNGRPGAWMQDDRAFDERYTRFPEYVADFAPRAGIRWFRGAKLHETAQGSSVFSVVRPADARPFDERSMSQMRELFPHLARMTRLLNEFQHVPPQCLASRAAAEALSTGLCVVDARLRVVFANRAALGLLTGAGPATICSNVLSCNAHGAESKLRHAIALATRGLRREARSFCPNPDDILRLRFQMRVLPLNQADPLAHAPGGPFALVFIARGTGQPGASEIGDLFGLTASEADLVRLLSQGLSPAICADRRNVSISTIRSQLKAVYGKTGVNSLSQLMSLVLALPGLL